jgi:hypothetical protein
MPKKRFGVDEFPERRINSEQKKTAKGGNHFTPFLSKNEEALAAFQGYSPNMSELSMPCVAGSTKTGGDSRIFSAGDKKTKANTAFHSQGQSLDYNLEDS